MNKRITYASPDGGVCIVIPAPQARLADESEGAFLARIAAKDVPAGVTFEVKDVSEIPTDRTFRGAWKPDMTVDMSKARNIHRDALRAQRAPRLAALDVAYQRADESGDAATKAAIRAEKQMLRDITAHPSIEAASTPDELKLVTLP